MELQGKGAHLIGFPGVAVSEVTHVKTDCQRLVAGQSHVFIDQEDRFLAVSKREFFIHRVEGDRFPGVGAALVKLSALLRIDLLIFVVYFVKLGLSDVMQQGGNGNRLHPIRRKWNTFAAVPSKLIHAVLTHSVKDVQGV